MLKNLTKNQIEILQEGFKNEGESSYEFILGNRSDVIISAPHSCSFTKEGKNMPAECNSGVIAKLLNKYFGYSILCKTKNCGDDANSDEKSDYKNQLATICRKYSPIVVLDLHCTTSESDFVVNVCSSYGKTLQDDNGMIGELIGTFKNFGIYKVAIDQGYSLEQKTVSNFISNKLGQKAVQIEINNGFLEYSPQNLVKIVNALHSFCQTIRKRNEIKSRQISLERLREIDDAFSKTQSLNDFEYVDGISDIVLSAPHAKNSVLNGKLKPSESITGSICKLFYKEFGFSIIYKSKDNDQDYFNTKTNEYKTTLFKKVLKPSTKLYLELHVLNKDRVQDVTLFLPDDYNKEKLYQIINILNNHNLQYFSINSIFDSYKKTRTVNQIKNDCFKLQICFNQRLIDDDERLKDVVECLKDLVASFII